MNDTIMIFITTVIMMRISASLLLSGLTTCSMQADVDWPLQDIRSLQGVRALINHPFITPHHLHCPHCCNTIA